MERFLSEENLNMHREYLRDKRLKYSILESSIPELSGASTKDVLSMKLDRRDRADALRLISEIELHDIYFTSFGDTRFPRSKCVADFYGSETAFLNEVFRRAMSLKYGFITVYRRGRNILLDECSDYENAFRRSRPMLAVDICEHAYLKDYGFDRERYLLNSLPYLDITKLNSVG